MILNEKGNVKQFGIVIYPVDFVVVIGPFEKEVNKYYRPYEEEWKDARIAAPKTTGATYRVIERSTGTPCILIWIRSKDEFTSSIVSHECIHAAMEIFKYIGAELNFDDQEPFCYLAGNLVRLATGCFYEIPGIQSPVVSHDAFCNPEKPKKKKKTSKKK